LFANFVNKESLRFASFMRLGPAICRLLLFATSILWACSVHAQYRFESWTTDTGLPQNSINDIKQTRDGYIWLTTFDGLVRFDGVRFTVFDKGNTKGINSNRFLRLFEDANGDLWAGTEEGGLVRYHHGRFTSYGKEQGLTKLNAVYVTGDDQGNVIVYFADEGVMRFADERLLPVTSPGEVEDYLSTTRAARRVPCGRTPEQISCVGYGSWSIADGLPSLNRIGGGGVDDGNGALWLATSDPALVKIEHRKITEVYRADRLPGKPILFMTGAHCRLLSVDQKGQAWLTDLPNMQSQAIGSNVPPELINPEAPLGYEDKEGNLWFGTTRYGLFRARRQFIQTFSKSDGLTDSTLYPVFQDRSGVIWFGTAHGLFRYRNNKFEVGDTNLNHDINALGEDASGRVIAAGYDKAWIAENDHFQLIPGANDKFWTVFGASDGGIWLGGDHGLLHLKDGTQTKYKTEDGLAGDVVRVIIDDGANGLWIGCFGGLTHYANGKFTSWTEREGLPIRNVRALRRDADGTLWIGTYDGGLARFKDGKFTSYTMHDGLFNNGVFQILEDGRENFWISSNHGIYRVRRQELEEFAAGQRKTITSIGYGKADGMLNIECNGGRWPAGVKAQDGKLWFPTQDGVAVIQPDAIPVNEQPPPVFIESLLLDNLPVAFDSEVRIQPDQENFEIHYTALSFINSENIRFKYKLEGLDRDWIDAGTRRTAYYSHLAPGTYTFKVIAANSDGIWNTRGAAITLNVRPRFYQIWWVQALVVLGFVGAAVGAYRVRADRLRKAHEAQEEFSRKLLSSQEEERQRIAAELHDSLGQSLLIIKNRIALAQSDIDERETVTEQLGELAHSTSAAIEECREIAYNLRPYQISSLGLSKSLYGIFMRINEVSNIEASTSVAPIDDLGEFTEMNLYRIVQECVNNIIKHSYAAHASLAIERSSSEISMVIEDDGVGFVPGMANGDGRSGFGLIGIAERVRMLQGTCQIDSAPDSGTRVRIRIPHRMDPRVDPRVDPQVGQDL
jgi:signal transduction histidine kinase/ligand-binding sensor domain-containing protein